MGAQLGAQVLSSVGAQVRPLDVLVWMG